MDRRRFIPGTESLEGRRLMTGSRFNPSGSAFNSSAFNSSSFNSLFGFQLYSQLNLPITYQQKSLRIDRLPYYLDQITSKNRFLPKAEIKQIQLGLYNLMDTINKPPTSALNHYNYELRKVVSKQSLTSADVHRLNYAFTAVMNTTQAPVESIKQLNSALFQLVSQVDTASALPVTLGTNDYTLVLQTALAVGRPMPPPTLPRIAKNEGVQADAHHVKTPLEHPSLTGSYHFHTVVQLLSPAGVLYGQAAVNRNDNYRIRVAPALSPGVYKFQLRAVDTVGHLSRYGYPFLLKVVPRRRHHH